MKKMIEVLSFCHANKFQNYDVRSQVSRQKRASLKIKEFRLYRSAQCNGIAACADC